MTTEQFEQLFEQHDREFLKFERIQNRRSNRPDIHAFLLLDQLVPDDKERDIISSAGHDEIYLQPDVDTLASVITEDQVIELIRCGVRYDSTYDSLCMFV
jgi:hypothetical protein